MLQPIIDVLFQILNYFYQLTGNYGIAIIIITLVIRALTFPLMAKQMKSTSKMQELQPELKKLQEKYKDDKETLNKKTMELWQKHKVNPAAGCLPLLVQMPVLIAMFRVFHDLNALQTRFDVTIDPNFLGINLQNPDPYYILPVLAGLTTFLQSHLTMSMPEGGGGGAGATMKYFMPFMLLFISINLPAGLPLYFVVGNIFQLITHLIIKKPKAQTKGGANA